MPTRICSAFLASGMALFAVETASAQISTRYENFYVYGRSAPGEAPSNQYHDVSDVNVCIIDVQPFTTEGNPTRLEIMRLQSRAVTDLDGRARMEVGPPNYRTGGFDAFSFEGSVTYRFSRYGYCSQDVTVTYPRDRVTSSDAANHITVYAFLRDRIRGFDEGPGSHLPCGNGGPINPWGDDQYPWQVESQWHDDICPPVRRDPLRAVDAIAPVENRIPFDPSILPSRGREPVEPVRRPLEPADARQPGAADAPVRRPDRP